MKFRSLNLYTRILLWLLVNVLVLGAVFMLVLKWQFREGLQGVVGGIAGDRLQAIGQEMHDALSSRPESQWDQVLKGLGEEHEAKVALVAVPDRVLNGDQIEIPPKLRSQMQDMNPELRGRGAEGRPGPEGRPPPPPRRNDLEALLFGDSLPPPPERQQRPERPPGEDMPRNLPSRLGTFMLHTGEPALYYAGIRLPPISDFRSREGPIMLVIATKSMTGGGLFFDTRPWLLSIFGAMAISALLWFPFVKNITGSIRANMQATEQIAKGHFDVRVPEERGDEIGRLAHGVNQMAQQLDGLVRGQKRFLGDVAHELCGPIARMEMSLGILEPRLDGAEAFRLADVRDELRQISALVNELMSFSKAALGHKSKEPEVVNLLSVIEEAMQMESVSREFCKVSVPENLDVLAVPDLLRRAIGNILRNAGLHAPGTLLEIKANRTKDVVKLSMADSGPGVPEACLVRLFEPFYRVDEARTRETGGTGLGLSIVKTCIESCGGSVSASNRVPQGLIVSIELPCA
ncbi:MAG: HAMP domain-containing histidine kinase [Prosthecobacter sp.]|nr:HAMP domain-containing histidine kinase [Prosthecobacter sp.]